MTAGITDAGPSAPAGPCLRCIILLVELFAAVDFYGLPWLLHAAGDDGGPPISTFAAELEAMCVAPLALTWAMEKYATAPAFCSALFG